MTRTTIIAALLALAAPAHASDVGDVIKFRAQPDGFVAPIGCSNFDDAYEVFRLRTRSGLQYAASYANQFRDLAGGRACVMFHDPDVEWRIAQKTRTQYTAPTNAWFCLELAEKAKPMACFWVHLEDKPGATK